jgi:hypothetical protein
MTAQKLVHPIADSLSAGAAVGFGVHMLADVEVIVSIIAGLFVAASAGLSIYLNWQRLKAEKKDTSE